MVNIFTLSIGSIKKSLNRYHCWCVTPWNKHPLKCQFSNTEQISFQHSLPRSNSLSFTHLFSLMVRLSHFDVCNQVSTCASVQDVRHRDHQVVKSSALLLLSSTQLIRDVVRNHWQNTVKRTVRKLKIKTQNHCFNPEISIKKSFSLTSSPSGQLLISSPWLLLMDIFRVRGIQTCRRSSAFVSKVKPSILHASSPLQGCTVTSTHCEARSADTVSIIAE